MVLSKESTLFHIPFADSEGIIDIMKSENQ